MHRTRSHTFGNPSVLCPVRSVQPHWCVVACFPWLMQYTALLPVFPQVRSASCQFTYHRTRCFPVFDIPDFHIASYIGLVVRPSTLYFTVGGTSHLLGHIPVLTCYLAEYTWFTPVPHPSHTRNPCHLFSLTFPCFWT